MLNTKIMKHFMRYFCALSLTFAPFFNLNAQTSSAVGNQLATAESEILNVFGRDWVSSNPSMVESLIDCRRSRITLVEQEQAENEKFPLLSSYPIMNKFNPEVHSVDPLAFNVNTFNPFTYQLDFLSDRTQVIRIDGTDYIMIINPIKR